MEMNEDRLHAGVPSACGGRRDSLTVIRKGSSLLDVNVRHLLEKHIQHRKKQRDSGSSVLNYNEDDDEEDEVELLPTFVSESWL